jgi:hypothetical protein
MVGNERSYQYQKTFIEKLDQSQKSEVVRRNACLGWKPFSRQERFARTVVKSVATSPIPPSPNWWTPWAAGCPWQPIFLVVCEEHYLAK